MNAHPSTRRPGLFGRPVLTVTIVLAALLGMGLGGVALANRDDPDPPRWESILFATHPSAVERIAAARAYARGER